jgi:hypothetical protein
VTGQRRDFVLDQVTLPDYAAGTGAAHFVQWCDTWLLQSVDEFAGRPLSLELWQIEIVSEAMAVTDADRPVFATVLIVLPRKNGKTALLAAYALYRLLHDEGMPEILMAASSDAQAGRLFDAVIQYVQQQPALQELVTIREYVGEIARNDGRGRIRRVASDPKRLHGYNPSLVIADELAQWTTPALRAAWAALTTGGGARQRAQIFAITTAGDPQTRMDSPLGIMLDASAATGAQEQRPGCTWTRDFETKTLVVDYHAPWPTADPVPVRQAAKAHRQALDAKDEAGIEDTKAALDAALSTCIGAVKLANPASWITFDYLATQALAPHLGVPDFLQLHACIWSESEDQWIAKDAWDTRWRRGAQILPGDTVTLGFDGSLYDDSTALVAVRLDDGLVAPIKVWERPSTYARWEVPRDQVDAEVEDAFQRYEVVRMYADADSTWATQTEGWQRRFGERVQPWPTFNARRMAFALERFLADAEADVLGHDGTEVLGRHVSHAVKAPNKYGYGIRKPSKTSERKIDAAVAAVLAWEARCDALAAGEGKPVGKKVVFI